MASPESGAIAVLRSSGEEKKAMTVTTPATPSALIRPFTVAISDSDIGDLKQRLANTRWPNPRNRRRLVARCPPRERHIADQLLGARVRLAALGGRSSIDTRST